MNQCFFLIIGIAIGSLGYFILQSPYLEPITLDISPPNLNIEDTKLNLVKRYGLDKPEDILLDETEEYFYTGTGDGKLLKVNIETGNHETILNPMDFNENILAAKEEEYCDGNMFREIDCGRILGLSYDNERNLLIANSNLGIFRYDISSQDLELLLPLPGKFLNDVAFSDKDGMIYFTVSHHKFQRYQFLYVCFDKNPGYLARMDPTSEKQEFEIVSKDIHFANGVILDSTGDFLYVAETVYRRIWKFNIETKEREIYVENLPFYVDNLELEGKSILATGFPHSPFGENYLFSGGWLMKLFFKTPKPFHIVFLLKTIINHSGVAVVIEEESGVVSDTIMDWEGKTFTIGSKIVRLKNGDFMTSSVVGDATRFRKVA